MDWFKKFGHAFVTFFKNLDHVLIITLKFAESFFTGDEIKQAVNFALEHGELIVKAGVDNLAKEVINSQRFVYVIDKLIQIGVPQVKAQGLAGLAVTLVDNGIHDVFSFIENHIATDEAAALVPVVPPVK